MKITPRLKETPGGPIKADTPGGPKKNLKDILELPLKNSSSKK
jgi:hypothetical protein